MSTTSRDDRRTPATRAERLSAALAADPLAAEITDRRRRRLAEVASRRLTSVTVVLENLWDTHNVAAVVRTAEGLGLSVVHVVEEPAPYKRHPAILHGADRWIDVVRHAGVEPCFDGLRRAGFVLAAADLGGGCAGVSEVPAERPVALVFGSEKAGLTGRARELAELRFTIPMMGFTGSFNVSVSAAIALFDLTARRRRAVGREGDLDEDAALALARRWLRQSLGRSS